MLADFESGHVDLAMEKKHFMIIKIHARNLEDMRREGSAENQRHVSTESRTCACTVAALSSFAYLRNYSQSYDHIENEY